MNLDAVRHYVSTQGGVIKAWALRPETLDAIVAELGVETERVVFPVKLFKIPVVPVADDQPEGVIV